MENFCLPLLYLILGLVLGPLFLLNAVNVFVLIFGKCLPKERIQGRNCFWQFVQPWENFRKALSFELDGRPQEHIECFDGLRTIGVLSIITGHLMGMCE